MNWFTCANTAKARLERGEFELEFGTTMPHRTLFPISTRSIFCSNDCLAEDREIIAEMLAHAVVTGVFETLKMLEKFEVEPFKDGYEGSPYNDFVGRLDDWSWPEA